MGTCLTQTYNTTLLKGHWDFNVCTCNGAGMETAPCTNADTMTTTMADEPGPT